jgi:fructose-1,6-bisphosphatase
MAHLYLVMGNMVIYWKYMGNMVIYGCLPSGKRLQFANWKMAHGNS